MTKKIVIDDSFIEKLCPEYDCSNVGGDEVKYKKIIKNVEKEKVSQIGTLSEILFREIYNWKAARAIHHVNFSKFDDYNKVFKQAKVALKFPETTIEEFDNLPGIGIPVASTILHFIYPKDFPIVDFRTIEVLKEANNLVRSMDYYRGTSKGYCEFREEILNIAKKYTKRDIRKVDKALFAYHKLCFNSKNKN